eukprot:2299883-Prymnesium_polylepis.1
MAPGARVAWARWRGQLTSGTTGCRVHMWDLSMRTRRALSGERPPRDVPTVARRGRGAVARTRRSRARSPRRWLARVCWRAGMRRTRTRRRKRRRASSGSSTITRWATGSARPT